MISYHGQRTAQGCEVTRVEAEKEEPLLPRLDLCSQSETGFEWGYGGSGPAQLSLALLADAIKDEEKALELYQAFKWEVISRLPYAEWELLVAEVREAAARLEQEL